MKNVFVDKDGSLRNPMTLEKVGNWFRVDGVVYYVPFNKDNQLKQKQMNYKNIKTNHKMNETVKDMLKLNDDNYSLYALKRIEELEQEVNQLKQ